MNHQLIDFEQNYVLENELVALIPLEATHLEAFTHYVLTEPDLWFFANYPPKNQEDMRVYIETALKGRSNQTQYAFAVWSKKDQKIVGSTRFYDIDVKNKSLKLGYTWYGKAHQATGMNKTCKYLLLSFAFETLGFERVGFEAHAKNERSIAAMKSIGCTVEGILRQYTLNQDNTRRDTIVLSILKSEWDTELKEKLKNKILLLS